ncbi:MAG: hypothetical protein ACP5TL_02730 [Candidatus Micrarchaeia archaeon]
MQKKSSKKKISENSGKYKSELERIRALSMLSNIIKKGDVENVLFSEVERETESSSQSNLDSLIDKIMEDDKKSADDKKLELIEALTTGKKAVKMSKEKPSSKRSLKSKHHRSASNAKGRKIKR